MFKTGEVKKWIQRQIAFKREEPVTGFAVMHFGANGSSVELEAIPLPAGESETADYIESIIELAAETTRNVCEGVDGVQTFSIQVRFDGRDPFNFRYRHAGTNDGDGGNISSEPANSTGLLQMTMRHLEARERGIWGIVVQQQQMAQQTILRQGEMIDRLQAERYNALQLQEDLLSKKSERDIAIKREERKDRIVDEMVGKFMALAPIAVYKLTGKNLLGAKVADRAAASEMTDAFIVSLSEAQFNNLVGPNSSLDDSQKALLGSLMQDYIKRERAKNAKGGAKPEDDKEL